MLLASLKIWPLGVLADPLTPTGRAAWYSFAFFLRSSAATLMDVDTLEFNAGFRPTRDPDGRVLGQAFLSDTLQNGAGYCSWLGSLETLRSYYAKETQEHPPATLNSGLAVSMAVSATLHATGAYATSTTCPITVCWTGAWPSTWPAWH